MKNFKQFIALTAIILLLAGCSSNNSQPETNTAPVNSSSVEDSANGSTADSENNSENKEIEVDKGLLNVDITIPASFFEASDAETVINDAKEQGATKAVKNEDGSFSFTYPKSVHNEMMDEFKQTINDGIAEQLANETFKSLKEITHNDSFSEFTVEVDKEKYEGSMDAFMVFGLSIQGLMYNAFNGTDTTDMKITFHMKDTATGEIFDTLQLPKTEEGQ